MDQIREFEPQLMVIAVRRYDRVSMSLHWLTLALLVVLFASIWAREQASGDATALLLALHRSAGALIFLVTATRLVWKATAAATPPLPATLPRPQRWAARANEFVLYALLVAQPITGFIQSIARGKPFPLLGFELPALMARDKPLTHLFHDIHERSATVLLVLIALHACAAIFHGSLMRDGVLSSMLPSGPARK